MYVLGEEKLWTRYSTCVQLFSLLLEHSVKVLFSRVPQVSSFLPALISVVMLFTCNTVRFTFFFAVCNSILSLHPHPHPISWLISISIYLFWRMWNIAMGLESELYKKVTYREVSVLLIPNTLLPFSHCSPPISSRWPFPPISHR